MAYTEKESNELKKLNAIRSPSPAQKARIAALKQMKSGATSKDSGVKTSAGKGIQQTLSEAGSIFDQSGLNAPLDRINENSVISKESQDLINSVQSSLDPSSPNYVGAISPALKASLEKLQAGVPVSPEEMAQLNVLKDAQARTSDTADAISAIKGGLAGLNAEENTALRDRASRAASSTLATAISNIQRAASRSGTRNVFAGGAVNKATSNFGEQRLRDEQEQLLANIEIQDKRRGQFADVVSSAEQREAGRRTDYTDRLMTSKNNEFGRQRDYTTTFGGVENDNKNRVQTGQSTLGSLLSNKDAATGRAREFNIGQGNAERAARAAGVTGIGGLISDKDYGDRMIKTATSTSSSRRNGRGNGQTGRDRKTLLGGVASDPNKTFTDNVQKLIDEQYPV